VVLASSAVFLLAAHWVSAARSGRPRLVWVLAATLLGVWSRTEVLTFVAALVLLGLLVWRRRALRLSVVFAGAAAISIAALLLANRFEGVDASQAARYQWHTFLDSTPESWLTAECRADPTENCRERDGLTYFGPAASDGGVLPMVIGHPILTLMKTLQSAGDNLWIILGPNLSTFPGSLPFAVLVLALAPAARQTLAQLPAAAWMVALATLAESVLPPLSWAPPHPQYHLQMVLPLMLLLVPLLAALSSQPRARLVAVAFYVANAALSAFRYTRYPGY
jgi:hypothetical protein